MSERAKGAIVGGLLGVILVALLVEAGGRGTFQTVVIGLTVGSLYALVALGLALIYKAQRVFNFAQGEFGTIAIFVTWLLITGPFAAADGAQVSTATLALAGVIGVVVGIILSVGTYLFVVRKLADSSPVTTLVATAGIALFLLSLEIWIGEAQARSFPKFVAGGFGVLGIVIEYQTLIIVAVLVAVAAVLGAFFRTRTGTALLATSQEPFAAQLYGVSTRKMAFITWAAAGALAAIAALLAVGFFETFTPGLMTGTYLIPAFTAAILGGITSMPGAVIGGLALGVVQASSNTLLPSTWPGRPQIGVFAILVGVLLFFPRGLLGKEA